MMAKFQALAPEPAAKRPDVALSAEVAASAFRLCTTRREELRLTANTSRHWNLLSQDNNMSAFGHSTPSA